MLNKFYFFRECVELKLVVVEWVEVILRSVKSLRENLMWWWWRGVVFLIFIYFFVVFCLIVVKVY